MSLDAGICRLGRSVAVSRGVKSATVESWIRNDSVHDQIHRQRVGADLIVKQLPDSRRPVELPIGYVGSSMRHQSGASLVHLVRSVHEAKSDRFTQRTWAWRADDGGGREGWVTEVNNEVQQTNRGGFFPLSRTGRLQGVLFGDDDLGVKIKLRSPRSRSASSCRRHEPTLALGLVLAVR